jgi:uncharacterized protein (UPF0548 family)
VSIGPGGEVRFEVIGFSRPASRLARWAGPLTGCVQHGFTSRYLRSARHLRH